MKERNFENITFNRWGVKPLQATDRPKKEVYAFDTETYRGGVSICGVYGDGFSDYIIPNNIDSLLDFLVNKRFCKSHNFFFNVKYDRDAIIKLLPNRYIESLKAYNMCIYKKYKIDIIGNKAFKISLVRFIDGKPKSKRSSFFSDIATFYDVPDKPKTLVNLVKYVLKLEYKKSIDIGSGVNKNDITKEIIDYCLDDCRFTWLLANNVVELANSIVGVDKFYSPASISKSFLRTNFMEGYLFQKSLIHQMAMYSYNGGRFEILKKGYFKKLYSADINSAYPYQISKLINPVGKTFKNREYEPDSIYSYFLANIQVSEDFILSPFKFTVKKLNELLVFPTGNFRDVYINKSEYEILKSLDCKIKIKRAVHLSNKEPKLWIDGIAEMYYQRKELKEIDDKREHVLKLILNSLYGVTIQLNKSKNVCHSWSNEEENNSNNEIINLNGQIKLIKTLWKSGQWFNPIVANEITTGTRTQLFKDFNKYEDHIIMIATDSIAMNRKIPVSDSKELGGYGHEDKTRGVVLANGIYEFDNGKNGKRGLLSDKEIVLKDMFRYCNKSIIKMTKTRPKSLKEAMPFKTDNPNRFINIFLPFEKEVTVNMDKKRNWINDFNSFKEVLEGNINSLPLNYGR